MPIGPTDKLFLVVRADLLPGQQAVQAAHALTEFLVTHHEVAREWRERSNHLALLCVDDEAALHDLAQRACARGARFSTFEEPDLDDATTAVALEPAARRLVARLPLALQSPQIEPLAHVDDAR